MQIDSSPTKPLRIVAIRRWMGRTIRESPRRIKSKEWLVPASILLAVAALAGCAIVVAYYYPSELKPNTFRYELIKAALQVIAVAVIGTFVGTAAFRLQQIQLERSKRDAELREAESLKERKEFDLAIDDRRRSDNLISSYLQETIGAYHATKRIRRRLKTKGTPSRSSETDPLTELLADLSDQQLSFESLMRRAPLIERLLDGGIRAKVSTESDEFVVATLVEHYQEIESYLRRVVRCTQLSEANRELETTDFKKHVSYRVDAIVEAYERALLSPEPTMGESTYSLERQRELGAKP